MKRELIYCYQEYSDVKLTWKPLYKKGLMYIIIFYLSRCLFNTTSAYIITAGIFLLEVLYYVYKKRDISLLMIKFVFWAFVYSIIGKDITVLRARPQYKPIVETETTIKKNQYNCVRTFLKEHKIFTKNDIEKLISEFKNPSKQSIRIIDVFSVTFTAVFPLLLSNHGTLDTIKTINTLQLLVIIVVVGFFLYLIFNGIKNFVQALRCKLGINEEIINILNELYYECKK